MEISKGKLLLMSTCNQNYNKITIFFFLFFFTNCSYNLNETSIFFFFPSVVKENLSLIMC